MQVGQAARILQQLVGRRGRVLASDDGAELLVAEVVDRGIARERERAVFQQTPGETYRAWHDRVRAVNAYRQANGQANRLLFKQPIREYVTPLSVAVARPLAATDEQHRDLIRFVSPPFEWAGRHLNRLPGKNGGTEEVSRRVIEALLEGGMCGYWMQCGTIEWLGIQWRVPLLLRIYKPLELHLDPKQSSWADERWYVRATGAKAGGGTQNFDDASQWTRLLDNPPAGVYAGVFKLGEMPADGGLVPEVPYFPLLDALLGQEMMLRADLSSLGFNERYVELWYFDVKKMLELEVDWVSTPGSEGNLIAGAIEQFDEARRAMRENDLPTGEGPPLARSMTLPDYIRREEQRPGVELIQQVGKYRPLTMHVESMAGLVYSADGSFIESESERRQEVDFRFFRNAGLEVFWTGRFAEIADENARWFPTLNRTGGWSPFLFESGEVKLPTDRSRRIETQQRNRRRGIEALLRGALEPVRVTARLRPSAARRSKFVEEIGRGTKQGLVPVRTYHESIDLDFDVTREEMRRQHEEDIARFDPRERSLWTAPPTYTQAAYRPDGSVTVTGSEESPGRPREGGGAGDA